ncbi:hypothetical protein MKX01_017906 [Papaver californicum]|nr:hypothetical protein MKX01_017906 [Papaver californicum]
MLMASPTNTMFGILNEIPGVKGINDAIGSASSAVGSMVDSVAHQAGSVVQGALELPREVVSEGVTGVTNVVGPVEGLVANQGSSLIRDISGLPFKLVSNGITGGITAANSLGSQVQSTVEGALKLPQIGLGVATSVVKEIGSQARSILVLICSRCTKIHIR